VFQGPYLKETTTKALDGIYKIFKDSELIF